MSLRCPLDGHLRKIVESDRYAVVYHCGWCGEYTRDDYDPTPANDLQRAYDPRSPA